ncbi:MAG: Gfo/Idh/MocA family oxidoreductase [Spirochaetales bacterium]|nr:Gfo/Idh/MocA family oxidoreductase [Spirochaetales bacterium]
MSRLRAGVVGLGMGKAHIQGYRSHPNVDMIAIADLDQRKLDQVGVEFGINNRYTSTEEMLEKENLDIVSIAPPNAPHKPLSLLAFDRGCNVLCEKPMALNAAEGAEMLAASESAGKRLGINFSFRFVPQSAALKREVESGVLGDIYFARSEWHRRRGIPKLGGWFGQKKLSGGGPLIDLGVHRLDLALWLMGYPEPSWVMASTYNHLGTEIARENGADFDVEDLAVGLIKFHNGATLELEASWAANIKEKELMSTRLLGTKGGLIQRNLNEGYAFEAEMYVERNGSLFDIKLNPSSPPVESAMYQFAVAILNDTQHNATGEEGLTVMKLLDAVYASAQEDKPVQIV